MTGPLSLQLVQLCDPWLQLLSSTGFWLLYSLLVGLLANQLPEAWLQRPRVRQSFHLSDGRTRGLLGIRRWKRWIPDAGNALPGGISKATLVRRDTDSLLRFVMETSRAEIVHWALLPAGLLTALWLPKAGVLVNVLFALAFKFPCVLLQRYNRARLQAFLARLDDHSSQVSSLTRFASSSQPLRDQ